MRFLVTGATGLVGRKLTARLVDEGHDVRVLLRRPTEGLKGATQHRGDLSDSAVLEAAARERDCVVHLAAMVGDWGPAAAFHETNVEGTRRLLAATKQSRVSRFVYVSSFIVYGDDLLDSTPCTEDRALSAPVSSAYAHSKRDAEGLCREMSSDNFAPTIVRPGNIFGPQSALWVDEVARALRSSGIPLIDGGHGRATLAGVDNVVELLIRCACTPAAAGRIYNANDGADTTWREYLGDIAAILKLRKPSLSIPGGLAAGTGAVMEFAARALGKKTRPLLTREAVRVLRVRAAVPIDRARKELGYEPVTSYAESLRQIQAYLENKD